jgi:hypothetical protein
MLYHWKDLLLNIWLRKLKYFETIFRITFIAMSFSTVDYDSSYYNEYFQQINKIYTFFTKTKIFGIFKNLFSRKKIPFCWKDF